MGWSVCFAHSSKPFRFVYRAMRRVSLRYCSSATYTLSAFVESSFLSPLSDKSRQSVLSQSQAGSSFLPAPLVSIICRKFVPALPESLPDITAHTNLPYFHNLSSLSLIYICINNKVRNKSLKIYSFSINFQ